ncbi:hypothetical protein [uncultured Lutibacter sp.]|uniref:hypothetical protein n=1 Tax=uncultured Lutibacter sp. TaxID=437739 RepID=UPI002606E9D3|nr:hypothetical protein [uncultured Lutibacter sp.]
MKLGLFKKVTLLLLFNMLLMSALSAQDANSKWVVGVGVNAVDYFPFMTPKNFKENFPKLDVSQGNPDGFFNEISNAEDHWNVGGPSINVTRYWKNRISLDVQFSMNKIKKLGDNVVEETDYLGFDGNVQYCFVNPENYFIPYVYAGGGYTFADKSGGTVNAGVGGKYWFNDAIGFCAQGGVKYNSPDFSLIPHVFYTFSVVMKLDPHRRFMWNARKRFNWRNGK